MPTNKLTKTPKMKHSLLFSFTILLTILTLNANAQALWTGPTMKFSKASGADWKLEENQDRITDKVWITRADKQGIFNIATETAYTKNSSPSDTEWAFGTLADTANLTYKNWQSISDSKPASLVGKDLVLHLISDDIYIGLTFNSWSTGKGSTPGEFSYTRTTKQVTNSEEVKKNTLLRIFPNPSSDFIQVTGLEQQAEYEIYDALGRISKRGNTFNNQKIDIKDLPKGSYLININNGLVSKFIKK